MGKVLQFKCRAGIRCDFCSQKKLSSNSEPVSYFVLPLNDSYALHLIKHQNEWLMSRFVEKVSVDYTEKTLVEEAICLCPDCGRIDSETHEILRKLFNGS